MTAVSPPGITNSIISALPKRMQIRILDECAEVMLQFGQVLVDARHSLTHVYFPMRGFISLVAVVPNHRPLEIGLIGNEGMLGATVALRIRQSPIQAVVQGPGSAWQMPVTAFERELEHNPILTKALGRYLYISITQLARTSACARFHHIEPRLARWLLMTHDRAHADSFYLTHDYLASMLGVRRSGVSIAAHGLQRKKLIRYHRGEIRVLHRLGLESVACDCYAAHSGDFAAELR